MVFLSIGLHMIAISAMLFLPGEAPKRPTLEEVIHLILGPENCSLSEEEFVIEGIKKLRKDPYKGINSVFSGFNETALQQFAPQFAAAGITPVMGAGSVSDEKQPEPMVPGSAALSILEARFTVSPITVYSILFSDPIFPATTSPVVTPHPT
jgi:hypothetical protein